MRNAQRAKALRLTLPVLCGYLFLGFAFGATMTQAGFGPLWVLSASSLVYAGSLQFVMVPFLASGISLAAVALTALTKDMGAVGTYPLSTWVPPLTSVSISV